MKEKIREHLKNYVSPSGRRPSGKIDDEMVQSCLEAIHAIHEGNPERPIELKRECKSYGYVSASFLIEFANLSDFLSSSVEPAAETEC